MRIRRSRPDETQRLFEIWRAAVHATHGFVASEDLRLFARIVRDDYLPANDFWLAVDENDRALAFMGMSRSRIDSLFVDPQYHRRGAGTALVAHARRLRPELLVDVNEQNVGAVAFYLRLGFEPVGRSPLDESGRPYPLIHLKMTAREGPSADRDGNAHVF